MPRQPNPLVQPLLDGELIYIEDAKKFGGRAGGLSQHMRHRGHVLRSKREGNGIYFWAEETGIFETWANLTGGGKTKNATAS